VIVRVVLGVLAAAAVFAIGLAVGESIHDNPKPGISFTSVTTIHP
jgi:hypothetical protein